MKNVPIPNTNADFDASFHITKSTEKGNKIQEMQKHEYVLHLVYLNTILKAQIGNLTKSL